MCQEVDFVSRWEVIEIYCTNDWRLTGLEDVWIEGSRRAPDSGAPVEGAQRPHQRAYILGTVWPDYWYITEYV